MVNKYYKVVTKDLKSAWLGDSSNILQDRMEFIVQYKVDEFVKPFFSWKSYGFRFT